MPKSFIKNIIQEIRHSIGRFLSIMLIVAIGVAFFAGIKASAPDMKYSADCYFDTYNVQDIQVYSTIGLTNNDVDRIKKIDGVKEVQPTFSIDTVTQLESSECVIKVLTYKENQSINHIRLIEGRMPVKENECVIQASSATTQLFGSFKIGDILTLSSGTEDNLKDTLKNDTYQIVGTCYNPNYLSYELGSSNIGSGSVNSFIYIQESNLLVDYYTEIDVTVKGAKDLNTYNKKYFNVVDPVKNKIDDIAPNQIKQRIKEQQDSLNKAAKELDTELDKAEKKINEGKEEIKKGEQELEDAKIQLENGWNEFYKNAALIDNLPLINDALQKISDGESKLPELMENKKQLEDGLQQLQLLEQGFLIWNELEKEYGDDPTFIYIRDQLTPEEVIAYLNTQLATINARLLDPSLTEEERQTLEYEKQAIEQFLQYSDQFRDAFYEIKKLSLEDVQSQIAELQGYLNQINDGINQINEGIAQKDTLLKQRQQLLDGNEQLKQAYITLCDSQSKYEDGLNKLEDAKRELQKGIEEFETNKEKYTKEIEDAQKTIDELEGEWIVLNRDSHYSYRDYGACADRMDGIAKVFPVFFFLVAALVCMTTMTRMVDEQRSEIGTLKALGYSKLMIASKYLIYAFVASVAGSILGCAVGLYLFPVVIYSAWNMLYNLEAIHFAFQPGLMFVASASVTGITLLATIGSIQAELKDVPSQLMRPKSGKAGKKIFLEKITFIWNRLSFLQKVTARNIFRYKKRFYMTIVGIAGCSALLVAGFGINDSISDIVHQQYGNIYHYDSSVSVTEDSEEFYTSIKEIKGISDTYKETQMPVTVNIEDKDCNVTVHIIDDIERLNEFTTLHPIKGNEPYILDDQSVIISQKMADKMGLKENSTFIFKDSLDKEVTLKVTGIYQNYVGHHIFVTRNMYDSWRSHAKTSTAYLLKQTDTSEQFEKELGMKLMEKDPIKSVTFYSSLQENFSNIISSISMVVVLLVASAAALAFVVLYNLSNVNISERIREIATIKVLGFLPNEVAAYVNRESIVLTMIGALFGLVVGIGLHHLIMNLAEMDDVMFGRTIKPVSYVIAFIMTMFFSFIVNTFMKRKLKKVQMVESLKAVE